MHDVFISYSSAELTQAETVRNVLEENGIPCWMAPRDIPGGSNYTKEIPTAIRGCQVFVLILSRNAQNSQWVLRELDAAVNNGKVIMPFMLEDCALSDEFNFLLTGAQRYAAYQKKAEALENLVMRIKAVTVPGQVQTPETAAPTPVVKSPVTRPVQNQQEYLGVEHCPACGGSELKPVKKCKRVDLVEWLCALLIPGGVIAGGMVMSFLGIVLCAFIYDYQVIDVIMTLLPLIGLVGGGILGSMFDKTLIRRRRVRRHMSLQTLRCCDCDKLFVPKGGKV